MTHKRAGKPGELDTTNDHPSRDVLSIDIFIFLCIVIIGPLRVVRYGWRRNQFDTFKYSMLEERLEQVREIDGELAYGKMRRALEKASQEKASQEKARQARQVERARQVESARRERAMQETARQSRAARRALGKLEKRRPERGGPERDFGPSR